MSGLQVRLNRCFVVIQLIQKKQTRVGGVSTDIKLATPGFGFSRSPGIFNDGCGKGLDPGRVNMELDNQGLHVQNEAIKRGSHKDSCGR